MIMLLDAKLRNPKSVLITVTVIYPMQPIASAYTVVVKSLATLGIFFFNYEKLIIFGLIYMIDCLIY